MIDRIAGTPTCMELLVPSGDQQSESIPEISIVVPALNEQTTMGEFVDWCWVGLKAAGVSGEVIIVDSFHNGSEFVMGSRFRGYIEDGAMPRLHRYFGTPLTTWILNRIYRSPYSDIHCGMRGLTKEALLKIGLTSGGWEYASEMVLKAARLGLKISEVPVNFYKDREGRLSHHRRAGF